MNRVIVRGFLALCMALLAGHALADAVLDQAKRLLDAKQGREAYALLAPLEQQRAGDPDFDYLLGIAALDSGLGELAVFALERSLTVRPDFPQARAEIARAYAFLGERDAARREMNLVKSTAKDITPEARATIDRFLDGLARPPSRVTAFIEGTVGVDSNLNSATGSGSLAIPALGQVTLAAGAARLSGSFFGFAAGGSFTYPLNEELALTGGARSSGRLNNGNDLKAQFDTTSADVEAGVRWTRDKDTLSTGYQGQTFWLDNNRFRNSGGMITQWQRNLSDTKQLTLFTQWADLSYPTQTVRNALRTVYGAGYAQAFDGAYAPVLFLSGYFGEEVPRDTAFSVAHLGHKPVGIRGGVQFSLRSDLSLNLFASYETRRYGGREPLYSITRKDGQTDLRAALAWKLADDLTLNPQISYTDSRSNIALFKFERILTSVSLRKDF